MDAVALEDEIIRLLALGYEGAYWDFKSDYTDVKEDKLIDVICMANNICDRDAYLIHGAEDNGEIVGIENTKYHRATTADYIKFLRDKPFAGDFLPDVEVKTLQIEGHELDVVVIHRSNKTPFYLTEDYCPSHNIKKTIRAGAIYTRTEDVNTPREKTANIEITEYLWKKRFGYDLKPFDRYSLLLDDYKGWSEANWDSIRYRYCMMHPEFKICAGESKEGYETLRFFYDNPTMCYTELHLDYYGTTLYETELWYMDCGSCILPKPQHKAIGITDYRYFYFIKSDMDGKLLNLFSEGRNVCHDRSGLDVPVFVFEDMDELISYESYFKSVDKSKIIKEVSGNAIIQHKIHMEEKELNGTPVSGVLELAVCHEVYTCWKKRKNIERQPS